MKRKHWIGLLVVAGLLLAGVLVYAAVQPTVWFVAVHAEGGGTTGWTSQAVPGQYVMAHDIPANAGAYEVRIAPDEQQPGTIYPVTRIESQGNGWLKLVLTR